MTKYIVTFVTCSSKKEAKLIANKLLNEKLAACVNIIEGISSFFWWKGKLDKADESLLIIKTVKKNFGKIRKTVKKLHSYEVPEIIALPVAKGNRNYLKWIDESIKT
jgi:periplasmic divalent cation tolerance protein